MPDFAQILSEEFAKRGLTRWCSPYFNAWVVRKPLHFAYGEARIAYAEAERRFAAAQGGINVKAEGAVPQSNLCR